MSRKPVLETLQLPERIGGAIWTFRGASGVVFHRHAELELNLALSGHAVYLVGSERVRLSRRSLLWLYPAQNHILIESSPDFSMGIAVWKPAFLQTQCRSDTSQMLLRDDPEGAMCKRVAEDDFVALESVFSRLEKNADDELLESGLPFLLHIARAAFERAPQSDGAQAVHPCVERAARALRDMVPPPSAAQLARHVGLSPSRLSRLFNAQTGVSLTEFRTRQCHERALRLCETDLPLGEVALQAGFGSYAQFHRVFCARSGCNPNHFRRKLKTTDEHGRKTGCKMLDARSSTRKAASVSF